MGTIVNKIIASSQGMRAAIAQAEQVANSDLTILITGESGVGEEVVAKYIHEQSARANKPFVAVNCGAIPETLFEAEFLGYERGAFTNAYSSHKGFFEQASNGTIFLDEVAELPIIGQVKLLRALESKSIMRIGGEKEISVDIHIISATNQNLELLRNSRRFRLDLYYRIANYQLFIPPLRDRKDDIVALARFFLNDHDDDGKLLSDETLRKLCSHDWPGNVRELEACIRRAVFMAEERKVIGPDEISFINNSTGPERPTYYGERYDLEEALRKTQGQIVKAARILAVHRNTVYNRARMYRINISNFRKTT